MGGCSGVLGLEVLVEDFDRLRDPPPAGDFSGPSLFVRGGASSYMPPDQEHMVFEHFPKARIATLDGAGHLLHIDKPEELRALLLEFCEQLT